MAIEQFIRNSDNQILLTLTEDRVAVTGAWTGVDIFFDNELVIHRTVDGDGVTFSTVTGILTINPGDLTTAEKTAIDLLDAERFYRTKIVITSSTNDDGAVFGGAGAADPLYFYISDKPS